MNLYAEIVRNFERINNKLRILHFRMMGIKIGKRCYIGRGNQIVGNVFIGDDCVIGDYSYLTTMPNGQINIGNNCHINSLTNIGSSSSVTIGDHCIFAAYVQIVDATHEFDGISTYIKNASMPSIPVEIGENVWLGSGVTVLKGVVIGNGSVVGARSVVTKSLAENSVSVGAPARTIRFRKSVDDIQD